MRFVGSFFLLSVAFISGYWLNTNFRFPDSSITQDLSPKTKVNRDKPYLEKKFSDLNGDLVSLKKWEAKLIVINFWGTWCPPCKEEMPLLSRLSEKFKYKNVQFIGVALDDLKAIRSFLESHPVAFPILWGASDVSLFMSELGNNFGSLPFTVVIDSQNAILFTQLGEVKEEAFSKELEKLVKSM